MHAPTSQRLFTLTLLVALFSGAVSAQGVHEEPHATDPLEGRDDVHTDVTHGLGNEAIGSDLPVELGLFFDTVFEHVDRPSDDGFGLDVRTLGITVAGQMGDTWQGHATIVHADGEFELEEAAVTHTIADDSTLRVGRFFAEFGRQMHLHVHDLPTPERPRVLAEFLGDELGGTGVEFTRTLAHSNNSTWHASLGIFDELGVPERELVGSNGDLSIVERQTQRNADEFALAARLGHGSHGSQGALQWGVSARHVADFALTRESDGLTAAGLRSTVFGADATYESRAPDGSSPWALGAEYLVSSGDLSAQLDGGALTPFDDTVKGFYFWGERRLDSNNALGLLLGRHERPVPMTPEETEFGAYYAHQLNASARLRFAVSQHDSQGAPPVTRLMIQLTMFSGAHDHRSPGHGSGGHD